MLGWAAVLREGMGLRLPLVRAQKRTTMRSSGTNSRRLRSEAMEQTAMGMEQTVKALSLAGSNTRLLR